MHASKPGQVTPGWFQAGGWGTHFDCPDLGLDGEGVGGHEFEVLRQELGLPEVNVGCGAHQAGGRAQRTSTGGEHGAVLALTLESATCEAQPALLASSAGLGCLADSCFLCLLLDSMEGELTCGLPAP